MAKTLLDVYDSVIEKQDRRRNDPNYFLGYNWCIVELNEIIGPIEPGWDVIVSAKAKVGKTSLLASQAISFLRQGARVCYFNLEESDEQTVVRMISNISGVERRKFRDIPMSDVEWLEVRELRQAFEEFDLHFEDVNTLEDVEKVILMLDPDVVIIDYMQLLSVDKRYDSKTQEMSEISRGLKLIARADRPGSDRKRIVLAAVQENDDGKFLWSRDPGRDADVALGMETIFDPSGMPETNKAKLLIKLSRHSRYGDTIIVYINLARSLVGTLVDASCDLNDRLEQLLSLPYGDYDGPDVPAIGLGLTNKNTGKERKNGRSI